MRDIVEGYKGRHDVGKQIKFVILLFIWLLFLGNSAGAFSPNIPLNTLKAAEESRVPDSVPVRNEKQISSPQSEIIRVGIGNQNFTSFVYKTIGVYATAPLDIYSDGVWMQQIPANTNVNVSINPDLSYTLKSDDNKEIAKYSGIIKFTTSGGCLGIKGLKRAGKPALYHGYFEVMKSSDGLQFNLVNKIPLEIYLRGVVPNEMPVTFGLEALKAQTVAARNYVLTPRTKSSANYDVVDSVASQVYFGANTEKELSNRAIAQTEGIVALYDWNMILALYSSTAGGYTESYSHAFSDPVSGNFPSAEKPYLKAKPDMYGQDSLKHESDASTFYKSKPDSYDIRSPYYRWVREWDAEELRGVLQSTLLTQSSTGYVRPKFEKGDTLDELVEIKVLRRGESGKVVELEVITKTQTYKVFKELVIRRLFTKNGQALPSANVVFENNQDEDEGNLISIKAYGGGFGHGVGMSQFGAGFMGSELHLPFDKILRHYYSGIVLGTKPVIVSSEKSQRSVVQSFYAPRKSGVLVVDNKFQLEKLNANINGKDYTFSLPNGVFGSNRCVRLDISDYIVQGKNVIRYSYPDEISARKAVRLFVELVGNDGKDSIWER